MVGKRFTDKVVVVTGGSQGIGLACVKRFQQEGATVCAIQRTLSENVESYQFDLSNHQDCQKSIEMVLEKHRKIFFLVNNAVMMN